MAIIGSGPIGCELGQGFQRLGTEVTIIEMGEHFLPREDTDAAYLLQESMKKDGVQFTFKSKPTNIHVIQQGVDGGYPLIKITYEKEGETKSIAVNALLIAAGRRPNVEELDLEKAEVEFTREGITVDNFLKTSNDDIYGVGDCVSKYQFTHNSDTHARYVVRNALFYGQNDKSKIILPWCTYTHPEIAHVGKYPRELNEEGIAFDTYHKFMDKLDRALCEGTYGIMKIHTR